MELLDSTEKLMEAQSQVSKLQTSMDNIMKERVCRSLSSSQFPSWWFSIFLTLRLLCSTWCLLPVWRLGPRQRRLFPPRGTHQTAACWLWSSIQGNKNTSGHSVEIETTTKHLFYSVWEKRPSFWFSRAHFHLYSLWFCQELQDRIDELQAELRDFHSLGRVHQPCHNPLSEELESKSPGMESDPGGSLCSASQRSQ